MVVDRDDRIADRPRFGVGQQRLGSRDDRHVRSSARCGSRACTPGYARLQRAGRGEHQVGNCAGSLDSLSPERLLVRRLGATLAIIAVALVGTSAIATAAAVPLAKVTVTGAADAKPTVKFAKPFATSASAHRVVTAGTGDKLAKGTRITFDYLVIDGRTGAELGTSFGAAPVATVLDTKQTAKGLVNGPRGLDGREPGAHRARRRRRDSPRTPRATAPRTSRRTTRCSSSST